MIWGYPYFRKHPYRCSDFGADDGWDPIHLDHRPWEIFQGCWNVSRTPETPNWILISIYLSIYIHMQYTYDFKHILIGGLEHFFPYIGNHHPN